MIDPFDLLWYVVILCCTAPALFLTGIIGVPAIFIWIMDKFAS